MSAVSPAGVTTHGGRAPSAPHADRPTHRSWPHAQRSRTPIPTVSVVVPTRNEARNLEIVLPAIAAVRPTVHEIIVVDGDSTDGTVETAQRVLPWVRVIKQTRKGKGNAMACGFAAATGDVIVMFDADGSADPAEIPAFVVGADRGRRLRQGQPVHHRRRQRRHHAAAQERQRGTQRRRERAVRHQLHRPLLRLQRVLVRPAPPARAARPIDAPAPQDGMLWGDGFEIETVLNCRVAAAGLKITEVPSIERQRVFGDTNLRTFADGARVLRTLLAEHRRADRRKSERR